MPSDPMVNPAYSTTNVQPVIRRPMPVGPDKPQWLQGKMTFIGIGLGVVAWVGRRFGVEIPVDIIKDFLHWLDMSWTTVADGIALIMMLYGRIRLIKRLPS